MTYFSPGDVIDLVLKLYEKGPGNLLSRLNPNRFGRTKAAFNKGQLSSNWWIVPAVKERWNTLISGDPNMGYEDFFIQTQLREKSGLKLLSIGCGVGSHEIHFAQSGFFSEVLGFDLAEGLIRKALENADKLGLSNCRFECKNILKDPPTGEYDVILFHSSLHHFDRVHEFLKDTVSPLLKPNGLLLVNEYVGPNRLQWNDEQLRKVNQLLREIPPNFRKTVFPFFTKGHVYRPGVLRMLLSDPSEAPDSESIRSALNSTFRLIDMKEYGGNVLHLLLKDIAHNFLSGDAETKAILTGLFQAEDSFLQETGMQSDFIYAVYGRN